MVAHDFRMLADYTGGIWSAIFAGSFLLFIAVGIIQHWRGKALWDTRAMPALAILHYAWVLPIVLPMWLVGWVFTRVLTVPFYLIAGAFWLWRRIPGKRRRPSG